MPARGKLAHETRVGHRLRNKVGIIIGCIDLLCLTEGGLSAEGVEDLARMRRAAKDILQAIEDLE